MSSEHAERLTGGPRLHHRHSSVLVRSEAVKIMIDRGRDWVRLPKSIVPDGILLTHAHDDHAVASPPGSAVRSTGQPRPWRCWRSTRFPIDVRSRRAGPKCLSKHSRFNISSMRRLSAIASRR